MPSRNSLALQLLISSGHRGSNQCAHLFLGQQSLSLCLQSWSSVLLASLPVASAALWADREKQWYTDETKKSNLVKNLHFFQPVSRVKQRTDISQCQTKYCINTDALCSVKDSLWPLLLTCDPLWVLCGGDQVPQSLQLIMQIYHVQNWLRETKQTSLHSLYSGNKLPENLSRRDFIYKVNNALCRMGLWGVAKIALQRYSPSAALESPSLFSSTIFCSSSVFTSERNTQKPNQTWH